MTNYKDVYERFINIVIAAEKLSDMPSLDAIEKRILHILSTYWSQNEKLTVNQSVKKIEELSSATAFKYLKQLRTKGYIQLVIDEIDNRVKYVLPTSICDEYFSNLGRHLIEATNTKK